MSDELIIEIHVKYATKEQVRIITGKQQQAGRTTPQTLFVTVYTRRTQKNFPQNCLD